jgi:hypothetical protein
MYCIGLETKPKNTVGIVDSISVFHIRDKTELVMTGKVTDNKVLFVTYNVSGYSLNSTHTLKKLGLLIA